MRTWVLFTVLLMLPTVAAQAPGIHNDSGPTETTMYVHLGLPQDFPINTQPPDDRYGVSKGKGVATTTNTCMDEPVPGLVRGARHTWYGYSSPGYVEYQNDVGGEPRVHPERGLSFDVDLDTSKPVRLTWYVESQAFGGEEPTLNGVPFPVPQVVMRATLREGDDISVEHEALNTGRVIAQAQTEPAQLTGPATDHPQVRYEQVGQDGQSKNVYEFSLEIPYAEEGRNPQVPADESFNLRIDLFIENPACGDPDAEEFLMSNAVRLHSSPGHRPRFTWDVLNPLRIEYLHPQFIGDDLVIHSQTNSPWGNYDVRGDRPEEGQALKVSIEGPSPAVGLVLAAFNVETYLHDHHTEPAAVTWVWPYKAEMARPGTYTVTLTAVNDQETAESVGVATFTIGDGSTPGTVCTETVDSGRDCKVETTSSGNSTPGLPVGLLLAALGAVAALRRR